MTCDDCGKTSLSKDCETHKTGSRICKDCCIVKMNGHKCGWWNLCWS